MNKNTMYMLKISLNNFLSKEGGKTKNKTNKKTNMQIKKKITDRKLF